MKSEQATASFRGVSIRTDDLIEFQLERLALEMSQPGERRVTRARAARAALLAGLAHLATQAKPRA